MNIITHTSVAIDLTSPRADLFWYDQKIPSGRIYEAWLNGENTTTLIDMARAALVYRAEKRLTLVVTRDPKPSTDTIREKIELANDVDAFVVERLEETPVRPLAPPERVLLARFESMDPTPESMLRFIAVAQDMGHEVASWKGRRGDLVERGKAREFLSDLGVEDLESNAHQLVRAKVITGRPGGLSLPLDLSRPRFTPFKSELSDGTLIVSEDLERPWQGTLQAEGEHAKGIARPPLVIGALQEAEAVCVDMAFGKRLSASSGTFHALSHLPSQRASLSLQAILFACKNPADTIRKDTERLRGMDPMSLFVEDERRKIRAGVPASLFAERLAPWRWAGQIQCGGIRATVFASAMVPRGHVSFLDESWEALKCQPGETITLHRDPALPNASSMHDFVVYERASWASGFEGPGIVLNPLDKAWKDMGGDFDGDAAVAFRRDFPLARKLPKLMDLSQTEPQGLVENDIGATLVQVIVDGLAPRLGSVITCAQRLAERGYMDDGARVFTADLAQACVSAQKHAMDTNRGNALYAQLLSFMDMIDNGKPYLLDELRAVRRAPGNEEKEKAWNELVRGLGKYSRKPSIRSALRERCLVLDELYRAMGWLRRHRAEMPKAMRDSAAAACMQEFGPRKTAAQQRWLTDWKKELVSLIRELGKARMAREESDSDAEANASVAILEEKMAAHRLRCRLALRADAVSPQAVVAWGTAAFAAEYVPAEVFESVAGKTREVVTGVRGATFVVGDTAKVKFGTLKGLLFEGDASRNAPLLALDDAHEVKVTALTQTSKSQKVHVEIR